MLKGWLVSRFAAGLLMAGVVFCVGGTGFATVWDQSCEYAISGLQETQQRIQFLRGELVAHEMHQKSSFNLVVEAEWSSPQTSRSELLSRNHKMRNLINRFNGKLKVFSQNCLNDHSH